MKNIAERPIEWSIQSVTQYDLANHLAPAEFNRDFYAFTPTNPRSAYFSGYQVRNGLADDPSFEVKDGIFHLHWLYLENEVWLDSPVGWLAITDRATHYAMVERFAYQPDAKYPGNASVIFYKNGVSVGLDEKLAPKLSPATPSETPYYMEAELNSPMVSLRPGESYAFETLWFPTRTGDQFNTVNPAGIVAIPMTVVRISKGLLIEGTFGVFFPGNVLALFVDGHGSEVGKLQIATANPLQLLQLHATVEPPVNTKKIALHLIDDRGVDRGVLSEAQLPQSGTGDAV